MAERSAPKKDVNTNAGLADAECNVAIRDTSS